MTRLLLALALVLMAAPRPAPANGADALSRAMIELRGGEWGAALKFAGVDGAISRDVIEWHRLRAGRGTVSDIVSFLQRRPDWPGLDWLRRKSEPVMATAEPAVVLAFYKEHPPQTAIGALSHGNALIAAGRKGEGEAEIVLAWRTMAMGSAAHSAFLKQHKKLLAPHHGARLDRLLWDNHDVSATRMLPIVAKGEKLLAEARIALQKSRKNVNGLIDKVPNSLRNSPGLAFDRFEWRARKRQDNALEMLLERSTSAEALGLPEKWARRRVDLARRLMRAGDAKLAYRVASNHFTTPDAGYVHADLEWLSGFLALRKLDDPAAALRHFQAFDAAIRSPISKGRAGYWIGRAHEALGDAEAARAAYTMGAAHQTSFYGLLAAERAGLPFDADLHKPPALPSLSEAPFRSSSVFQAALMMLASNESHMAERFLTHLVESLDNPAASQLGRMAVEIKRPHLAVMISKRAARRAVVLHGAYYPLHPVGELELPMAPEMTLAIARRESEFDPSVISGAGARGLMQVMPKTASLVARELGLKKKHSTARLTQEWEYNAKLGANYLSGLARDLGGNVVMMSAGYNAGPGRPIRWMKRFGDPRTEKPTDEVDIVDWIEHIPFNETRNYVMRVAESLPVYRARLGKDPLPVPFSHELTGSTLKAFAPKSE